MAMTNEQLTKWIDEIFGTIDEIKQNSGDISGLTRSVRQLRADVTDLEDQTTGTVTLPKAATQHFTDGSATQPLDMLVDINAVKTGTGALSGHSSVTVTTTNGEDTNTATSSLGSTVYGGALNPTTGELISDMDVTDLGDLTYYTVGFPNVFAATIANRKKGECRFIIGNDYTYANPFDSANDKCYFENTDGVSSVVYFKDSDYSTVTDFKAAMTGVDLAYEIATPTTTSITPAPLQLLQGENTVSASSGDLSMIYAPDNVLAEIYAYIQTLVSRINSTISALDARVYALEHPTTATTRKTTKTLTKKED